MATNRILDQPVPDNTSSSNGLVKVECAFALLCSISLAVDQIGMTGSGLMIVLSFGLLSLFYFLLSIWLLNRVSIASIFNRAAYRHLSTMRIITSLGLGMVFSTSVIGICFLLMRWPGAGALLLVSLPFLCLSAVAAAILRRRNDISSFYGSIMIRCSALAMIIAAALVWH